MIANILDGIVLGLQFGLLAVGLTLVYGMGGVLNLAYGQMAVVAFIEPPREDVNAKILRGHQSGAMFGGLWRWSAPRAPPADG